MLLPHLLTSKLVQNSSKLLRVAKKVMPEKLQNLFVLHQLNRLAKGFLADGELDFLEGRVALVQLTDLSAHWYFTKASSHIVMLDRRPDAVDVTFSATVNAMVLMASQQVDPDTLFFNRDLSISGDTELGLEIKNLLDRFDLDLLDKPFRKILDIWSNQLLDNNGRSSHA